MDAKSIEYLLNTVEFETVSDRLLAEAYLECGLPMIGFKEIFESITEKKDRKNSLPRKISELIENKNFNPDHVTFLQAEDIDSTISSGRRMFFEKMGGKRLEPRDDKRSPPTMDVLSLVINHLKNAIPLEVLAAERDPIKAFNIHCPELRNLSLAHPSLTHVCHKAFHHRAIVPHNRISQFTRSPLCGDHIKEMVIYWDIDTKGALGEDMVQLDILLHSTPYLESLAFCTSLEYTANPNYRIDECLQVITGLLPNLKRLWLRHHRIRKRYSQSTCRSMTTLCRCLPQMRNLEHLSVVNWGFDEVLLATEKAKGRFILQITPPKSLKSIELDLLWSIDSDVLSWILEPRGDYALKTLSVSLRFKNETNQEWRRLVSSLKNCFPNLNSLNLYLVDECENIPTTMTGEKWFYYLFKPLREILFKCKKLEDLGVFVITNNRMHDESISRKLFEAAIDSFRSLGKENCLSGLNNLTLHFNRCIVFPEEYNDSITRKVRRRLFRLFRDLGRVECKRFILTAPNYCRDLLELQSMATSQGTTAFESLYTILNKESGTRVQRVHLPKSRDSRFVPEFVYCAANRIELDGFLQPRLPNYIYRLLETRDLHHFHIGAIC